MPLPSCRVMALAAWLLVLSLAPPLAGAGETPSAALLAEARRSFTLNGKQIPPEVFRDFGDGDLADSGAIWVTIDVNAAIGSNLYFDPIEPNGGWLLRGKRSRWLTS
jgi:hypothetical protein